MSTKPITPTCPVCKAELRKNPEENTVWCLGDPEHLFNYEGGLLQLVQTYYKCGLTETPNSYLMAPDFLKTVEEIS